MVEEVLTKLSTSIMPTRTLKAAMRSTKSKIAFYKSVMRSFLIPLADVTHDAPLALLPGHARGIEIHRQRLQLRYSQAEVRLWRARLRLERLRWELISRKIIRITVRDVPGRGLIAVMEKTKDEFIDEVVGCFGRSEMEAVFSRLEDWAEHKGWKMLYADEA